MNAPRLWIGTEPAIEAASWMATALRTAIAERGVGRLALCGGSTPAAAYASLARETLDWQRVELYFGDERCVPPLHPDSTYRLVEEALVRHIAGPGPTVVRMEGEAPDYEAAAARYAAALPERLDAALLGMGPDGHTASLFPGQSEALESEQLVVHIVGPKPPPKRLTLTPLALGRARARCMLVTGKNKAQRLKEVLTGPLDLLRLPAQLAREDLWILDEAAASELPESLLLRATR